MPFTDLDQAVADLNAAVAENETVDASAIALIAGFSAMIEAEVTKALQADDAADEGSIQAVKDAINAATASAKASNAKLGDAIVAGTPAAPAQG